MDGIEGLEMAIRSIQASLEILVQYATFTMFFLLPAVALGFLFWWFYRTFFR